MMVSAVRVKRPKRPVFRPTSPEKIAFNDHGIIVVDDNPEYDKECAEYGRALGRYERAFRLFRLATGKVKRGSWDEQEIGVGILRCPERSRNDRPPWEIQRLRRASQRRASKSS